MAGRKRAPRELRNRIQDALDKEGIRALARRLGIAVNTLYNVYKGASVNVTTITHVEAHL